MNQPSCFWTCGRPGKRWTRRTMWFRQVCRVLSSIAAAAVLTPNAYAQLRLESMLKLKAEAGIDAGTRATIERSMEKVVEASKELDPLALRQALKDNAQLRANLETVSSAVKSSMGSGALALSDQQLYWRVANYVGELRVEVAVRSLALPNQPQTLFEQTLPLRNNQDGVQGLGCFGLGNFGRLGNAQSWANEFAVFMTRGRLPPPPIKDTLVNGAIPRSGPAQLTVAVWPLKKVDERWGIVWELVAVDPATKAQQVVAWYTQNNGAPGTLASELRNAKGVDAYLVTAPLVVGLTKEEAQAAPAVSAESPGLLKRIFGGWFSKDTKNLATSVRALADTVEKVDLIGVKTVLAENEVLRAQLLRLQREVDAELGAGAYQLTQKLLHWNMVKYSGAMRVTLSVQTGNTKVPVAEIEYPNLESRRITWGSAVTPCQGNLPVPPPSQHMTTALRGVAEPAGTQTRTIWLNPRFPTSGLHRLAVDIVVSEVDSKGQWSLDWELMSNSFDGKNPQTLRQINANSNVFGTNLGKPYSQTIDINVSGSTLAPLRATLPPPPTALLWESGHKAIAVSLLAQPVPRQ